MGQWPQGGVRLQVCGEVAVAAPDGAWHVLRGRQPQVVLAYLALERGPVRRDELADVLWHEQLSSHWRGALRGVLSKVRTGLVEAGFSPESLRSADTAVRLTLPPGTTTDLDAAEADVEDAERWVVSGRVDDAVVATTRAASILTRPFLPHEDGEWSQRQRLRMDRLEQRAARIHVRALLAQGHPGAAAERARDHVQLNLLDEEMHHELIVSLLADGRRADAVGAFERLRHLLHSELGIAPAEQTSALLTDLDRPSPPRPSGRRRPPVRATPFVGRAPESSLVAETWTRIVARNRPEMIVLAGPAGIGKTTLAHRVCDSYGGQGAITIWGTNRADDGRAFGAVADALSSAFDADPGLLARVGDRAAGLVRLLPELWARFPEYRIPTDDAEARTHLFGAVPAVFEELARGPTVIVLDDLHWAPDDTLRLLEAALDGLVGPMLVLATARHAPDSWEIALGSIQRALPVETVPLAPLTVDEVAELLAGHAAPFDPPLVEEATALHARTGGLPFFATEFIRDASLSNAGTETGGARRGVRDWIRRRTRALPRDLRDVLAIAAVIGHRVDIELLERCRPDIDVLAAVEDLIARGLLADTDSPGSVQFSHAITRDAVYDDLQALHRMRLHRAVGDALTTMPTAPGTNEVLAHHARHAGPDRRGAAAGFAWAAGRDALAVGAWDQAAEQFDHSLASAGTDIATARAMIGLGRARLRQRRFDDARQLLAGAAEVARDHHLPFELAEATLALVGRNGRGASPDRSEQIERLRAAYDGLMRDARSSHAPTAEHRRVMLLSEVERELAMSLLLTDAVEDRTELAQHSLRRARRLEPSEPAVLAGALLAQRIRPAVSSRPDRRLADIDEVLHLPVAQLPPDLRIGVQCARHEDLLQVNRRQEAVAALDAADQLLDRYPDPYWQWVLATWRSLGLVIDGDLAAAETAANEANLLLPGVAEARAAHAVTLVNIRLYQGRAAEVVDLLAAAVDASPNIPCYRAVLALAAWESDDVVLAEQHYRWFADHDFANLPPDTNRFLALAVLGHVAAELGDEPGGAVLEGQLLPFDDQLVILNCFGGGGAYWGPTAHVLARLAWLAGREAEARARIERALVDAQGSPPALERITRDLRALT